MSTKAKLVKFGTTRTYSVGNGFYVDVVKEKPSRENPIPCYSVWLYNVDYGVKEYVFGEPVAKCSWKQILERVRDEIYDDEHVHNYYMAYM